MKTENRTAEEILNSVLSEWYQWPDRIVEIKRDFAILAIKESESTITQLREENERLSVMLGNSRRLEEIHADGLRDVIIKKNRQTATIKELVSALEECIKYCHDDTATAKFESTLSKVKL
jgi:hypothetical protein